MLFRDAVLANDHSENFTHRRLIVELAVTEYRLEDLLANMTPEKMGDAFDWGDDLGRENVDD